MCSFFRSFFRSIRNYFFYNECHNYDAMELVLQLEKMLNNLIKANYKTWTDANYAKCVASRIHSQLSDQKNRLTYLLNFSFFEAIDIKCLCFLKSVICTLNLFFYFLFTTLFSENVFIKIFAAPMKSLGP